MVAAVFRTIFAQPDPEHVATPRGPGPRPARRTFPKVGPLMDDAKAEVLAFTAFPTAHWRKIWSTNPLERVNKEIKRRSRVVGIFPNAAAVIRPVRRGPDRHPRRVASPTTAATSQKSPWPRSALSRSTRARRRSRA